MILGRVVYDAQFSFVTIYKVGKCMMPSVLKICSDFKSHVVYSRLKFLELCSAKAPLGVQQIVTGAARWKGENGTASVFHAFLGVPCEQPLRIHIAT